MESNSQNNSFDTFLSSIPGVEDKTACFAPDDVEKNKVAAILSSLGGLFTLIGWLINTKSPFNKFYVNQGIWATIVNLIPIIGQIAWIICAGTAIYGIVINKFKTLPLLGGVTIVKSV